MDRAEQAANMNHRAVLVGRQFAETGEQGRAMQQVLLSSNQINANQSPNRALFVHH
jgi:hypothetical protein